MGPAADGAQSGMRPRGPQRREVWWLLLCQVCYRDLKAKNVLLDLAGQARRAAAARALR